MNRGNLSNLRSRESVSEYTISMCTPWLSPTPDTASIDIPTLVKEVFMASWAFKQSVNSTRRAVIEEQQRLDNEKYLILDPDTR